MDMTDVSSSPNTRAPASRQSHHGARDLLLHLGRAWPTRAPTREIAGLPLAVVEALRPRRRGSPFRRAAEDLDRALPGWSELAADAVGRAASGGLEPDLQRACALLGRRPLRRPDPLLQALADGPKGPESEFWLLAALAGTDTSVVRAAWIRYLSSWLEGDSPRPQRAHWFAFLRAALGGWLTWSEFRECLSRGRVLDAAARDGRYRPALERLGVWQDPAFAKWYRQAVYEAAHQPDASVSLAGGAWIRDFPDEDYLWDALSVVERQPNSWWHLHVLRWASGIGDDDPRVTNRLREASPLALCLLSLLRPELSALAGPALGVSGHQEVIKWLLDTGPNRPLDLAWVDRVLRPWVEVLGAPLTFAAGALCSIDPPHDFIGPSDVAGSRRAFVREYLLPGFDRVMGNLFYVQAVRREHLDLILEQARRGRPAAVRALALWPESAEHTAPTLFRISREGTKAARGAAREALEALARHTGLGDVEKLEKRVDLASAWSDGGLEGKAARAWWDVQGYHVRLSVLGGSVRLATYRGPRRLASVPRQVREDPQYKAIREARADLDASYRYFRRRLEQGMVERVAYSGRDFTVLLANPIVRSLVSRVILRADGEWYRWEPEDALYDSAIPAEISEAETVLVAHPLDLLSDGALPHWQQEVIESRIAQPFKQVFRELYLLGGDERESAGCDRFAGYPLIPRRAFALLRRRGYSPRQGDAVREWPRAGIFTHIVWAAPEERVGRRLQEGDWAEPVTSGSVWFDDGSGEPLPLPTVPPVVFSETLRDADLVISRAASGEMGFTSEETRRMRAVLVRYLAQALGLTTIYVSEDDAHVLVEGRRATYRVHLGSGSVLLEESRRNLDLGSLRHETMEALVGESMDSRTARIIGIIGALGQDHLITDPQFLAQLDDDGT